MTLTCMYKAAGLLLSLSILSVCCIQQAAAQQPTNAPDPFVQTGVQHEKEEGPGLLRELLTTSQQAYARAPYLGFGVRYVYTNEGRLSSPVDSLSGEVQMDKGRYRLVIDGTETVMTANYAIRVMGDERMIYLSSPRHTGMENPLGMLDTLFAHIKGLQAVISREDGIARVTLKFPPGQPYSMIKMEIDSKTGYFRKVSYSLFTADLVDQDLIDRPGHPGPYQSQGQIDVFFNHYEQGRFNDSVFDEGNFFHKIAGRFQPSGRYKDYQIFLASSNL